MQKNQKYTQKEMYLVIQIWKELIVDNMGSSIIETINDELKNNCQIEHSWHCSFTNFLTNMISALLAYSFLPKKPKIKYETQEVFR